MLARKLMLIPSLLVLASLPALAALNLDELSDVAARIQYAVYEGDFRTLSRIAGELSDEKARPPLRRLLHYYAAYAAYRAAELAPAAGAPDGDLLELCEEQALEAAGSDEEFADAFALAGACAALDAGRNVTAVLSARRAERFLRRAQNLAPRNPRVVLLQAVSLLRRPSLSDAWGEPVALLRKAETLFAEVPAPPRAEPDWGEAETSLLLAEIAMRQGERLAARDAAEHSLMVAPDYLRAQDIMRRLSASAR